MVEPCLTFTFTSIVATLSWVSTKGFLFLVAVTMCLATLKAISEEVYYIDLLLLSFMYICILLKRFLNICLTLGMLLNINR